MKELYDINEKKIQEWAVEKKITDVIVYKMDRAVIDLFVKNKINVYIGVPIETPKFLIDEYLNGRLESDESVLNNEINE